MFFFHLISFPSNTKVLYKKQFINVLFQRVNFFFILRLKIIVEIILCDGISVSVRIINIMLLV